MSGGAMDYVYYKLEVAACETHDIEIRHLLEDLSKVLRDEEWYYSGDISEERYLETRQAFMDRYFKTDRKDRLREYLEEEINKAKEQLEKLI